MRCFKTVADSYVEPVSFIVPRRAETFQEDVYPPTVGLKAAMSAADWFAGKDGLPPKISLESVYDGNAPVEVASTYKPPVAATPASAPAPAKAEPAAASAPVPTPAASRAPPPSVKDNEKSIASMADKFADNEEDSEDDASSFEEVPKPVERPTAVRQEIKTSGPTLTKSSREPTIDSKPSLASAPAPAQASTPASAPAPSAAETKPPPTVAGAAEGLRGALSDIKSLLDSQSRAISTLTGEVQSLTTKVTNLEARQGSQRSDREKDERIRELELELEEARS